MNMKAGTSDNAVVIITVESYPPKHLMNLFVDLKYTSQAANSSMLSIIQFKL